MLYFEYLIIKNETFRQMKNDEEYMQKFYEKKGISKDKFDALSEYDQNLMLRKTKGTGIKFYRQRSKEYKNEF